jgi:ribosomal protein S15P/S13E
MQIRKSIIFQGVILRDSHGVAQVRFVTGNKILRILKAKGLAPDLPEDLYHLIKKAVSIRKHLERNRKVGFFFFYLHFSFYSF